MPLRVSDGSAHAPADTAPGSGAVGPHVILCYTVAGTHSILPIGADLLRPVGLALLLERRQRCEDRRSLS